MSSVFEPSVVVAALAALEPSSERKAYVTKWNDNVSRLPACHANGYSPPTQVQKTVAQWKKNQTAQLDSNEQLEFATHTVEYTNYVQSATSVHKGAKSHADPPVLKAGVPLLGPLFLPITYIYFQKRSKRPQITPKVGYLKPIHIIHPFYYPNLKKCPQCDSMDEDFVSWQGWTSTGYQEMHGVF